MVISEKMKSGHIGAPNAQHFHHQSVGEVKLLQTRELRTQQHKDLQHMKLDISSHFLIPWRRCAHVAVNASLFFKHIKTHSFCLCFVTCIRKLPTVVSKNLQRLSSSSRTNP